MIGGCVKSHTCREKLKGKSDGRQICSGLRDSKLRRARGVSFGVSTFEGNVRSLNPSAIRPHTVSFENTGRGCSSVGKASDRHATDAGSIPRCGKGFFSQSQLPVQTLLRFPYSPRVQSHALTSVRALKIPSIGSHTFV